MRALGSVSPLGALPFQQVAAGIAANLASFSRGVAFDQWLVQRENAALSTAICQGDDLPAVLTADLTTLLPFLSLSG